jgi:ABC-type multidrug transport system ATPase subunit
VTAVLVVDGVGVKRAGRRVLDGVTVVGAPGEAVGVVGENGAGKSTLLSVCAGVLALDRGAVTIDGASVWGPRRERVRARARLGYVPEAADPPGHLSCDELHALVAAVKSAPLLGPELRARLGLTDLGGHRIDQMSLGQRRRACLGAALIGDPAVLILDEPTNGLDVGGVETLIDLLRSRLAAGTTLLVASHDVDFLDRVGAVRLRLEAGRPLPGSPAPAQVVDPGPDQKDRRDRS